MKSNATKEKENIYSLKGFDKVFKFTLTQTFKNKAYIVSLVMMIIMMAIMGPIQYFSSRTGEKMDNAEFSISEPAAKKITVADASGLSLTADDLNIKDIGYEEADISVENAFSADYDAAGKMNSLGKTDIFVLIGMGQTGYTVSAVQADDSDIPTEELDKLSNYLNDKVTDLKIEKSGLSEDDVKLVQNGVYTTGVMSESEYISEKANEMTNSRFSGLSSMFGILIMIVSTLSASYIIASVTEEKTSKLVESLLVSVRPMALLMGKICGMLVYIMSILVLGLASSKISNFVVGRIVGAEIQGGMSQFDFSILFNFGAVGIILLFASVIIAYIAFGSFSGMMGSACTKTEDVQSATGTVMGMVMLGYIGSTIIMIMDNQLITTLACFIPPFSLFTNTVYYLGGKISLPMFALSFVVQIFIIIVLLVICAKTYRRLILNGSSKPKLIDIFRAMKN